MKRVWTIAMAAVLAGTVSTAYAQVTPDGGAASGIEPLTTDCTYVLSTLANFSVCISSHGNLNVLTSPALQPHIGGFGEGYAICSVGGSYHDFGFQESGWQAPTLISQSASKVALARTTVDNRFTLTQTWTRDPKEHDATVSNVLKANIATNSVFFVRYADINANGDPGDDAHDYSRAAYWIRDLEGVTGSDVSFASPTVWVGAMNLTTCNPSALGRPFPANGTDKFGFIRYFAGNMGAGSKKTFKVAYRVE